MTGTWIRFGEYGELIHHVNEVPLEGAQQRANYYELNRLIEGLAPKQGPETMDGTTSRGRT